MNRSVAAVVVCALGCSSPPAAIRIEPAPQGSDSATLRVAPTGIHRLDLELELRSSFQNKAPGPLGANLRLAMRAQVSLEGQAGGLRIRFHNVSADPFGPLGARVASVASVLENATVSLKLNDRGAVERMEAQGPPRAVAISARLASVLAALVPALPGVEKRAGDSWTETSNLPVRGPQGTTGQSTLTADYRLGTSARVEGQDCRQLQITLRYAHKLHAKVRERQAASEASGTAQGRACVNVATGMPEQLEITMNELSAGLLAPGQATDPLLHLKQQVYLRLRARRAGAST